MAGKRQQKRRIRWNIGMIVFLVIFIYVMINIISYFTKEKLTVYRVTKDEMTTTFSLTGIALRDESLLKASQNGYITYYVEEGKRVKKKGTLYILDKDGNSRIRRRRCGEKARLWTMKKCRRKYRSFIPFTATVSFLMCMI